MEKTKILFVCHANRDRSPTAAKIYSNHPELEVKSAGVSRRAYKPVSTELVEWADVILTMEDDQKLYIEHKFPDVIAGKMIDSLDVQDEYNFMDPHLENIIKFRVDAWMEENLRKGKGK